MRARLLLAVAVLLVVPGLSAAQCRVEGTVRGTERTPIAGATVALDTLDGHALVRTQSDIEGRYVFDNVRAGTRVRITVSVAGRLIAQAYPLISLAVETVDLDDRSARRLPGEPLDVSAGGGPSGSVAGVVRGADKRPLPRAVVTIRETLLATTTDEAGRFVFDGLQPGLTLAIVAGSAGHVESSSNVVVLNGSRVSVDIVLSDQASSASERAPAGRLEAFAGSDAIEVGPSQLQGVPSLGESNLLRGVQFLPGIAASLDESSGLSMRGASQGQSLITVDGFTLYDGDHTLGTFGGFNTGAVGSGALSRGITDAAHGGRVAGGLQMSGERPPVTHPSGSVEAGVPGAGGSVLLPVGRRGSLLVAARTSWPGSLYDKALDLYAPGGATPVRDRTTAFEAGAFATNLASSFFDLNTTLDVRMGSRDHLTATFYGGKDDVNRSRDEALAALSATAASSSVTSTSIGAPVDYGVDLPADAVVAVNEMVNQTNLGLGAVWSRVWSPRATSTVSFGRSVHTRTRNQTSPITSPTTGGDYAFAALRGGNGGTSEYNRVEDTTLKAATELALSFDHVFTLGGELSFISTDARSRVETLLRTDTWELTSTLSPLVDRASSGRLATVFVQDAWRAAARLVVTPGVRFTHFDGTSATYAEPSVNVAYQATPYLDVRGGWAVAHQMTNWITREDLENGDQQFWTLADGVDVPVLRSQQVSVGADARIGRVVFGLNGYYRTLDDLTILAPRLYPGSNVSSTSGFWHHGSGNSQGGELYFQHALSWNTLRAAYTVSRSDESFPTLEDGVFPAALDRRHEFKVTDTARLKSVWLVSGAWVISTGRPYTPVEGTELVLLPTGAGVYQFVFGEKNSARLPAYHRLDLTVQRELRAARVLSTIGATVFNVYDRKNVWYREYQTVGNAATAEDQLLVRLAVSVFAKFRF